MKNDERNGLVLLIAFTVVCGVFLMSTTDGGRGISNIFSNLIVDLDYPPSATAEAQLAALKEPITTYWLIGFTLAIAGVVTLCAIIAFFLAERRLARSWCLLLMALGVAAVLVVLLVSSLAAQLAAIPNPAPQGAGGTFDGLAAEIVMVNFFGVFNIGLLIISALLFGVSAYRARRV